MGGFVAAVLAGAAAALLWTFTWLIARSLRSGQRFECFCFGPGGSQLSWRTLGRTGCLAGTASTLAVLLPGQPAELGTIPLQASLGAGVLALIVLGGSIPKLVRWNNDPFGLEVQVVRR
jgi:methylamine utilization protein MauE